MIQIGSDAPQLSTTNIDNARRSKTISEFCFSQAAGFHQHTLEFFTNGPWRGDTKSWIPYAKRGDAPIPIKISAYKVMLKMCWDHGNALTGRRKNTPSESHRQGFTCNNNARTSMFSVPIKANWMRSSDCGFKFSEMNEINRSKGQHQNRRRSFSPRDISIRKPKAQPIGLLLKTKSVPEEVIAVIPSVAFGKRAECNSPTLQQAPHGRRIDAKPLRQISEIQAGAVQGGHGLPLILRQGPCLFHNDIVQQMNARVKLFDGAGKDGGAPLWRFRA